MIEGAVAMSSLPMLCLDLKVLQLGMDAGPSTQEKKPDGKKKQKVEAPEREIFEILTEVKSWMLMPQKKLEQEFKRMELAETPLSMATFLETFTVRSGKKKGAEYYNQIMSTKPPPAIFEYERFNAFYTFVKWLKNRLEKTFTGKEGKIATRAAESLYVAVNAPEADNSSILKERLGYNPDVESAAIPISQFWELQRRQYVYYEAGFREQAEREARLLVTTAQQLQMTLLQIIEYLTLFYQQSSGKAPETTNEYTKLLRFFLVDLKAVLSNWDFEPPRYKTGVSPPRISKTPPKLREAIERTERGEATPARTPEGGEEGGEESGEEGEEQSGEEGEGEGEEESGKEGEGEGGGRE